MGMGILDLWPFRYKKKKKRPLWEGALLISLLKNGLLRSALGPNQTVSL